jgi:myo-inositol-1(or 4)-monophosphatase
MAEQDHRAAVAEQSARAGAAVARAAFRSDVTVETKANRNDLVTSADREAQAAVVATVREAFPEETFVLEESPEGDSGHASAPTTADAVPATGPVWVVDPIDGTANFVRGLRTWTTSVATILDGDPVGSATVLPAIEDAYLVGPDGVTRNGEPIAVSDRSDPETFAVGTTGWWDRTDRAAFGALTSAVVDRFGDLRRLGSFQATLAHVAAGGFDGAIAPGPTLPWDTIAGVHMVRRAGGTVTDTEGAQWTAESVGLVASNGHAHDALLGAARRARDED